MPDLIELHQPAVADVEPKKILSGEIIRAKPSLKALGIGFSVSYAKKRIRAGKPKKLPYFACCYNVGDLGNVNIVAFYYPLIADWDLMEKDAGGLPNAHPFGHSRGNDSFDSSAHSEKRYDGSIDRNAQI